jgi:hypothetical protein
MPKGNRTNRRGRGIGRTVDIGSYRTKDNSTQRNLYIRNDLWELITSYSHKTGRTKRSIVESAIYWYFMEKDGGGKIRELLNPDNPELKAKGHDRFTEVQETD